MRGKYHDSLRFLKKLSIAKLFNAAKVFSSFYVSKWLKRPIHRGMPMAISFEPTTACNLRCPECPSGLRSFTRETGNLKSDFFRKTINQVSKQLMSLTFYFQGEPYINPSFLEMVRYAHDQDIYTVTSTNGHFLDDDNCRKTIESGLDRIIISIDGTTQEVYEQYRKEGNLEQVLEGAKNLIRWKKEMKSHAPYVIFQFLVVAPNEHQIQDVHELAKSIGVDEVKLKTAQLYDYQNGNPLMPKDIQYSRYRQRSDGRYELKNKLTNECWKMWHSCVITWDGHVVPCCFDKDAAHPMGSTRKETFKEIWTGESAQQFRQQLMIGRDKIDICANCSEGCTIWA